MPDDLVDDKSTLAQVPSGNKSLTEPVLTKLSDAI